MLRILFGSQTSAGHGTGISRQPENVRSQNTPLLMKINSAKTLASGKARILAMSMASSEARKKRGLQLPRLIRSMLLPNTRVMEGCKELRLYGFCKKRNFLSKRRNVMSKRINRSS